MATPRTILVTGATGYIGGADVLTYGDLLRGYAKARGLKRWLVPVPVLTPQLSPYWAHLVTPIPANIAQPLIKGLGNDVIVRDDIARRLFPQIKPPDYATACAWPWPIWKPAMWKPRGAIPCRAARVTLRLWCSRPRKASSWNVANVSYAPRSKRPWFWPPVTCFRRSRPMQSPRRNLARTHRVSEVREFKKSANCCCAIAAEPGEWSHAHATRHDLVPAGMAESTTRSIAT